MSHVVQVVKAADLKTSGGQTAGMIRQNAFVDVCDHICSLLMTASPHTSSDIHHHGEENTIIYAVKGNATIVSNEGKTTQHLAPGDWAFIPAFAVHQEVNNGDEEVVLAIVRSGRSPIVENLSGWGQGSAKDS